MHLANLRWTAVALLLGCWFCAPAVAQTETEPAPPPRKVVNKVVPIYPEWAKTMNLRGTVKVEAVVAPNGTVKTTKVIGGHPVLAQAAERAIQKWKWVPAAHETSEPVEVRFDPQ